MTIVQGRSPQNKFKQLLDNENVQALGIFLLSLGIFLLVWELGANAKIFAKGMPSASLTLKELWWWLTNPFFNNGPNDMGIGWNLLISLRRVAIGYIMASVVAVPLGILLGMSKIATKAFNPYVQLLKPVSPLAWLPLGLYLFRDSEKTGIFIILISSIWPTLVNTAFGVSKVNSDYLDVAKTLGASKWRTIFKVIIPAALPNIISGLRISMGISWLVIVAAEMLLGTGLGYFIWSEWNNLYLPNIIVAIIIIGLVGLLLDQIFAYLEKMVSFGKESS
ncbi:nitrate ABC transporter permease [Cyanobacterium aponinum UTEX 3222]|uniref:Nitrate ABC transporter, inner membrane subunit n=3 Tax=Cyanobacterium aponinum TaxID=379064 RepID=K9Z9W2_CYAAP|nr:nitrate ABC transporter permease [Cyanobacterium aponinum]WRL42854.1 nitrate ABC transporter permease [Cyanobacterium aponinum UTEX 3222]AFZ55158.1 nitrate ABC transporter, inner membrane subunit [Cyanobacterium aponinum PCC 10605]MTF39307.1 nitrate ABC transporter permease [Cyanobacterium aponinum 0216]PHV63422.1 nitrate ABC transporter, permease protein [Cyanobacterium aponinum IPPAS B-1201]WPF88310.1 nitrate ABC transporter permease [Cyanobacterium aponinum AL20115]